jgi:ribonuclease Z
LREPNGFSLTSVNQALRRGAAKGPIVRPIVHPQLINDPFGDPGLYADVLFERRAMLFDLGDLSPLPARKLLRVSHVFVSHAHMDHFVGFDRLLRVSLGRDKRIALAGPPGFIDRIAHKLGAYTWNLVRTYVGNLALDVSEFHPDGSNVAARFESRSSFVREPTEAPSTGADVMEDGQFSVRAAALDHQTPCLAFALEEKCHVSVWPNRLAAEGLPVGPWLRELKRAVTANAPDDTPIGIRWRDQEGVARERELPLASLKAKVLSVEPGSKFAYVVDAVYSAENVRRIVELAGGADALFIEAPFLDADAAIAARKFHLTARQAGEIARLAGAKRVVPFHFSPRYQGRGDELVREAMAAFAG